MQTLKKGVTPEQIRQAAKDLNLTVAAIADGTGLSKSYISEFRNETRNLSQTQLTQLRTFLETAYADQDKEFPEDEESAVPPGVARGIGELVDRIQCPVILLSADVPKAQVEQLTDLMDGNRLKISELLAQDFSPGTFGEAFSTETEDGIRQLFALLALNYIAILILQGRNIARKLPDDFTPKTMGDWLSQYLAASPLSPLLQADPLTTKPEPQGAAA